MSGRMVGPGFSLIQRAPGLRAAVCWSGKATPLIEVWAKTREAAAEMAIEELGRMERQVAA